MILVTDEMVGKGSQGEGESAEAPLAEAVEVRPIPRLPVAIRPAMSRGESELALFWPILILYLYLWRIASRIP